MATKIEWAGESWNPIPARTADGKRGWHCEHTSPGCENCYAETQNIKRRFDLGTGLPYKPGHRKDVETFLDEAALLKPLGWKKPRKVFVCSMTDLFGDFVSDDMIDRVFAVMALCPQHTFQVLTKRSARMREWFSPDQYRRNARAELVRAEMQKLRPERIGGLPQWPLPNVWLGVSVEDQQRADERIPDLLATPAAIRWISAEPLLGPVEIAQWLHDSDCWLTTGASEERACTCCAPRENHIDWVVAGGESGKDARPMHPDWARSLRDQCAAANVPFFFKQWGEHIPGEIFHPESERGAGTVFWCNGEDEYNGGHIDLEPIISQHFPEGCPVHASEEAQIAAKGWIDGNAAQACAKDCAREACQQAERWCKGDDKPWLTIARRVGKKRAGRLLDGVLHDAMPGQG